VDFAGLWTLQGFHGETSLGLEAFFSVHQPLFGDGSVLALLLGQEGGNTEWGRAGITILEPGSVRARGAHLSMTSGHGLAFSYRSNKFRPIVIEHGERRYAPRRFPLWLRLQREGDRLTPFISPDGFGWTQLRPPLTLWNFGRETIAGLSVASGWGGPVRGLFSTPIVMPGRLSPLVQACSGNGMVLLTWPRVANARGYLVRRSAPDAPGFAADMATAAPIQENSFTDRDLVHGTPVRYLVSALFQQGGQVVEGWPTSLLATPLRVPGGLLGCDLNVEAPQVQGGITFDTATTVYQISGAGGGFEGREDHGYFAFRLIDGDFQITARILEKPRGMAGLMVRETLDGASRASFLGGTADRGLVFQNRLRAGELARAPADPALTDREFQPPLYVRLVRRGNTITSYFSRNGTTFPWAGTPIRFDPPLPRSLYVGYAVTSQSVEVITASTFSDLTISTP
jgi:hypothetical protein